ncbi:MAG: nucleotidyl transferase AbiEii/AbiGii toxin family protein [Holosporales bacterium]|jgi:predicted nucleotidyltransferase component of viral defense system
MDRTSPFFSQVQLLVRVLPFIAEEPCFALKGGTAINLFVRDLPRLSVDIDLVYLPLDSRDVALANVRAALERIATRITASLPGIQIQRAFTLSDALRMLVQQYRTRIKIELSPVLRGTIFPPQVQQVRPVVAETFGFAELPVLGLPDLYAGKICAALDRQHPRDLFDIKLLLANEGIDDALRKAFLVYLISHNRPMAELLAPSRKDIRQTYEGEFRTMTQLPVSLDELNAARETLIALLQREMTKDERQFLLSFKAGEPAWLLLGVEGASSLPAVQWKQLNLAKMDSQKRQDGLKALQKVLYPVS